jgi:hypothetical protein
MLIEQHEPDKFEIGQRKNAAAKTIAAQRHIGFAKRCF